MQAIKRMNIFKLQGQLKMSLVSRRLHKTVDMLVSE